MCLSRRGGLLLNIIGVLLVVGLKVIDFTGDCCFVIRVWRFD